MSEHWFHRAVAACSLSNADANALIAQQVIVDLRTLIKELLDNALDAGATTVRIHVYGANIDSLEVADNGCGIPEEDFAGLAIMGATSKITTFDDIALLQSKGFRGEALFSIASTCRLEITTRTAREPRATKLVYWEGRYCSSEKTCAMPGTTVRVSDIFAKLPVRRIDLMKNAKSQMAKAMQLVQAYALMEPHARISFRSTVKKEETLVEGMPGESVKARAAALYGQELEPALLEVDFELTNTARISGVLVSPTHLQRVSHRDMQLFYINWRFVHTPAAFKNALKAAAKAFSHQAPIFALHLQVLPETLDVNLSPDKMEVNAHRERELASRLFEELEKLYRSEKSVEPLPVLKRKLDESMGLPEKVAKVDIPTVDLEERMALLVNHKKPQVSITPATASTSKARADPPLPLSPPTNKHLTLAGAEKLNFLQESFDQLVILGQFNKGFIIVLLPPNSLFIVDQHAADEKATFEDLVKKTEVHKQPLVIPQALHLSVDEQLLVMQHTKALERNGFRVALEDTPSGPAVKLLTKPLSKWTIFDAFDFRESVESLKKNDFITDEEKLSEVIRPSKFTSMFASRACRQAVMVGTSLERGKMQDIVHRLSALEKPWNCPHGRPTIRHLYDLGKYAGQEPRPPKWKRGGLMQTEDCLTV